MHPTDGMWREIMDGEADAIGTTDLEGHLASCSDCQRKVIELKHDRLVVAQLLNRLNAPVPARTAAGVLAPSRRRFSRNGLLAAAALILCVATAAATVQTGLYHRISDWLLGPRPWIQPPPESSPAAPVDSSLSSGIAFRPSGAAEIAFKAAQLEGEIAIGFSDDSTISITASAPVAYSVRQGRAIVLNEGSSAGYRITVPRSVTDISVRVAGQEIFFKHGSTLITRARRDGTGTYVLRMSPDKAGSP